MQSYMSIMRLTILMNNYLRIFRKTSLQNVFYLLEIVEDFLNFY